MIDRSRDSVLLRTILICVLLATQCSVLCGCKEGSPATSAIVPTTASFLADAPPPGASDLAALTAATIDGGRITLDVVLTAIDEPISGIALNLSYPDAFSRFVSCSDGTLFTAGDCSSFEAGPGSGQVFIGRSASGAVQAVPVSGSQVIVRLDFLVFGEGEGAIVIENQNLSGGDASAVLDANGDPVIVQWYAGMLRGT